MTGLAPDWTTNKAAGRIRGLARTEQQRTSVHELYAQALHLLNAVWHRRWAALGATWLVALLGWALVVAQPNAYTSSARIFIDATSVMKPVLKPIAGMPHSAISTMPSPTPEIHSG